LRSYRAISRITQHTPSAWDAGKDRELPVWTGAGQAYSDELRFDAALREHVYGLLIDAVAAWFDALEKAPPLIAPRGGSTNVSLLSCPPPRSERRLTRSKFHLGEQAASRLSKRIT
jgi:hypothetical protein